MARTVESGRLVRGGVELVVIDAVNRRHFRLLKPKGHRVGMNV